MARSYAPGLDGIRAIAVAAVIAYHLDARWLPGGFLGVDVFFVLSGYLITSLLVAERERTGRIHIGRFYVRRARRLLPALFTMLTAVALTTAAVEPLQLGRLRGDVAAATAYVTNWAQIAWHGSYFQALGPPSLLQHLWSLAVEEQFYLVWPVVLVLALETHRRWLPLAVTLAGLLASTAEMAGMYRVGGDPSRVYYGSDTHAAPLLVGAALALTLTFTAPHHSVRNNHRWAADLLGLLGAVAVGYAMVHVTYYQPDLYRGGYLVIAMAAAAVVHAAAGGGAVVAQVLGSTPVRWIGARSYGIYLWHWPILVLTKPGLHAALAGLPLDGVRVGLTVVVAAVSYELIEKPIRSKGLARAIRSITPRPSRFALGVAISATAAAAALQLVQAAPLGATRIEVDRTPRPTISIAAPAPSPVAALRSTAYSAPPELFARPVRVAFFGDSQGMTLLINRPAGLAASFTFFDDTIEGCGILGGTISSSAGEQRDLDADCHGWLRTWHARAVRDRPQIAVIEIGAWEVFDDTVHGTRLAFGSSAWDDYFAQQLSEAIGQLTSAGAQVALLGVPCYQPISAGGLTALPERGDRNRTGHLDSLLRTAAHADPQRVFFIRPPPRFCTDPSVVGNTAYRWDGVHFYKPGAALEFQVIAPQLLAIPEPRA